MWADVADDSDDEEFRMVKRDSMSDEGNDEIQLGEVEGDEEDGEAVKVISQLSSPCWG